MFFTVQGQTFPRLTVHLCCSPAGFLFAIPMRRYILFSNNYILPTLNAVNHRTETSRNINMYHGASNIYLHSQIYVASGQGTLGDWQPAYQALSKTTQIYFKKFVMEYDDTKQTPIIARVD
jgi:hypothetical protein